MASSYDLKSFFNEKGDEPQKGDEPRYNRLEAYSALPDQSLGGKQRIINFVLL